MGIEGIARCLDNQWPPRLAMFRMARMFYNKRYFYYYFIDKASVSLTKRGGEERDKDEKNRKNRARSASTTNRESTTGLVSLRSLRTIEKKGKGRNNLLFELLERKWRSKITFSSNWEEKAPVK
ncbi:hypothetical protein K0M31_004341 [Melipona bicolor]|uniref:Uncharacterized protein n=1 Tax=Melipona bicolor TaxID=60889 RepID=A0AA40FWQ5_9HYME|nr:hypothetical protein K0M31_004341 [Melipona bicolor]